MFHRSVVHVLQCGLILGHLFFRALVAVGFHLYRIGHDYADYLGKAEAPSPPQGHDHRSHKGCHDIGQLMGDKALDFLNVLVHDLEQISAAHKHFEVQWHFRQIGSEINFDLIQRSERRQMRAHQRPEIQQDIFHPRGLYTLDIEDNHVSLSLLASHLPLLLSLPTMTQKHAYVSSMSREEGHSP